MYLYKITNLINNKVYIGQTINYKDRWGNHKRQLNRNAHRNEHLQFAWNKYEQNSFTFEIIDECNSIKESDIRETYYIDYYNARNNKFGYNIRTGGKNYNHSEESKQKMSVANRGHKHSEETKRKISIARVGYKCSKETKNKISKNNGKPMLGKHHTLEARKKISIASKNRNIGILNAKDWPPLISPDGVVYNNIHDMAKFAKEHKIPEGNMRKVAHGDRKSHYGWKLYKPSN